MLNSRKLGAHGPSVSSIGLGCMGMSDIYASHNEADSIRTIHAAMEQGITMLNTGDFYGMGRNELLIAKALQSKRESAFISVKSGALRSPAGDYIGFNLRPDAIKNAIAQTLVRLDTDYIDLYQPSRVDPNVPIEESIGAIADLVKEGWVRHIGLSEAGPESIRKAHSVHPIVAHEVEYSLLGRDIENGILPVCRELGISTIAYSVLAGGILSGRLRPETLEKNSHRVHTPRFAQGNLEKNLELVSKLKEVAGRHSVSIATISFAWVMAQGDDIIPLTGPRTPEKLKDAIDAEALILTPQDLMEIEAIFPMRVSHGKQYDGFVQDMIDMERTKSQ